MDDKSPESMIVVHIQVINLLECLQTCGLKEFILLIGERPEIGGVFPERSISFIPLEACPTHILICVSPMHI